MFQYHSGPIKRTQLDILELVKQQLFQYHSGPIKRLTQTLNLPNEADCFNTTLVQLKVDASDAFLADPFSRFNTTLVQLKGSVRSRLNSAKSEFQYHSGPIKRKAAKDLSIPDAVVSIPLWSN